MTKPYKLGLALSGGGIKGLAHAGALAALEEAGLKPEIISGTSAGGIVAALYSAGVSPQAIMHIFVNKGFNDFALPVLSKAGLFTPHRFKEILRQHIPYKNIEDLPIPIRVVATDLDHGLSVTFSQGALVERVMASASVPVVFVPTIIDGIHYVDGGIFQNFPVSAIRHDCETVIGINVSPLVADTYSQSMPGIAMRAYEFMFRANTNAERKKCDILVETPEALQFGTFNLSSVKAIYQMGYEQMKKGLEASIL